MYENEDVSARRTYPRVGETEVSVYLSQGIRAGSRVHVGSIFRKGLQTEALFHSGTEP